MRDVCASRHRGNPESEAANERVSPSKADLRYRIGVDLILGFFCFATFFPRYWDNRAEA
jgi:hypothetical protein